MKKRAPGRGQKGRRPSSAGFPPAAVAWRTSPEFRSVARKAITDFNKKRAAGLICGAKSKRTGEPCRGVPLENGRCRLHGGLTPKGNDWHKPRFTARPGQIDDKIQRLQRREARRQARLRAMTPEQRAAYDSWLASHKPGSAAERRRRRENKKMAQRITSLLSTDHKQQDGGGQ